MTNEDKSNKAKEAIDEMAEKTKEFAEDLKGTVEDTIKEVAEEVAEEVKETAEEVVVDFKDKYLKVLAEMENLRKRFETERTEVIKYRASSFIQNILPTVDMFEMAMNSQNVSDEIKNWLVGFEMILNNFKSTLEGEGVKEINVKKGDEFDGNLHHAIEEVDTDEVEPGKIFQVKMKGYTIHDKLLRPATVTVAKVAKEETKEETKKETKEENKEEKGE